MQPEINQQLQQLMDSIKDETKLQLLMEDKQAYMTETENGKDASLTDQEMVEINEVIAYIDSGEAISWEDMRTTMKEWRER